MVEEKVGSNEVVDAGLEEVKEAPGSAVGNDALSLLSEKMDALMSMQTTIVQILNKNFRYGGKK